MSLPAILAATAKSGSPTHRRRGVGGGRDERDRHPGASVLVALENLFPPLPSEVILRWPDSPRARADSAWRVPSSWTTLGSIVGAIALYWIGIALARRLRIVVDKMPLVDLYDLTAPRRGCDRHGRKAVFFGRVRPHLPLPDLHPAGIERMPFENCRAAQRPEVPDLEHHLRAGRVLPGRTGTSRSSARACSRASWWSWSSWRWCRWVLKRIRRNRQARSDTWWRGWGTTREPSVRRGRRRRCPRSVIERPTRPDQVGIAVGQARPREFDASRPPSPHPGRRRQILSGGVDCRCPSGRWPPSTAAPPPPSTPCSAAGTRCVAEVRREALTDYLRAPGALTTGQPLKTCARSRRESRRWVLAEPKLYKVILGRGRPWLGAPMVGDAERVEYAEASTHLMYRLIRAGIDKVPSTPSVTDIGASVRAGIHGWIAIEMHHPGATDGENMRRRLRPPRPRPAACVAGERTPDPFLRTTERTP
ncbi:hypothetical protein QJS66_13410 [Kocuria rhizophila]|nr:hypothetical protein QJS66_13410 [Kocuria rhizophila]